MTAIISPDRLTITKAKQKAATWMPFLQSVFMPMRCTPTMQVPTAAVDQYGRMYYNPDFINGLSVEVVAYIILHECLHCVLSHHKRTRRMCPNIDAQKALLANIAQDLCIQQALAQQIGGHEPDGIVTVAKWTHIPGITAGKTSEQYFEALCAWQSSKPKPPSDPQDSDEEDEDEEADEGEEEDSDNPSEQDEDGDEEQESDDDGEESGGEGDEDSDEDGDGEPESDGNSDGGSGDQDSDAGGGEGDSESGGDGESSADNPTGDGGLGGKGQDQLDTSGMPDMGNVCNPADAGSGSDGVAKEWEEEPTLADISSMEKKLRDAEAALDDLNPTIGSGAGQIRQSLKARLHPTPDPFEQLRHVVSRSIASSAGQPEMTYRKWPRRTLPGSARLRGVQRVQPEATILLDTSGSMESSSVMARALAIIAKGISRLQNPRIVCCDGAIQSSRRVANMSNFQWDGGGGTDMAAGLVHVDRQYRPDSIIIITDGITAWPSSPTRAKVICALCDGGWANRIPKWITVVHLYKQGSQYAF